MPSLRGLCAFPITPTGSDLRVDADALRKLIARLVAAHVDSIGLLGSTGIYMYLSRDERRQALEITLEELAGSTPVVVGVGALRTDEAVTIAQDAKALGASVGLLAPVSYTPLTDEEVFAHFSAVAEDSGLPICIYDNPSTTHFRFSTDLLARLSHVPNIIGVKSMAGSSVEVAEFIARLRPQVPSAFSIGFSVDHNATEALIAGGDAWYSVLGGTLPVICKRIVEAVHQRKATEARRLKAELNPIWDLFREYSSLRVVYAIADELEICRSKPPRPILPLSDLARERLSRTLRQFPAILNA